VRLSRYLAVLCAIWVIAMTWRLYPHFKDELRVKGQTMVLADYLAARCGETSGPAATECLTAANATARRLIAREQGKSLLLVEAPLLGYLLVYLPLRQLFRPSRRSRGEPGAAPRREVVTH
jgi:hypothetical protein